MRPLASLSPSLRIPVVLALLLFALSAGCSDTSVDIPGTTVGGDSTLPNGFVATNRPPNPSLSFQVPCPLGIVPEGVDNPNVTLGCPVPDCIPAIDNPEFATVKNSPLVDFERVVAVEMEGQVRGFPIRILMYHEVVNICWNLSGGRQVFSSITYCPIVDVALHFIRPEFSCGKPKGQSYGVSAGLYNGNLIVYRRGTAGTTDALYVQMYGGGLIDDCLEIERVNIDLPWSVFSRLYPNAEVLTENTGFPPPPGGYDLFNHPYKEFWLNDELCVNGLCFPVSSLDSRLRKKTLVYGVYTPAEAKAYPLAGLTGMVLNDQVGGVDVVLFSDRGGTVAFEPVIDGQLLTFSFMGREGHGLPLYEDEETGSLWTFDGIAVGGPLKGERLPQMLAYRSFWYAWAAFFPETLLHEF
ncbi:MAG: DUF3179 domain-containing protein [Candidatus Krumholzibacteria bacterium]|nr:DUF3179 domain-containing protein [Candidatus Krumholzibacteria bacterium]